MKNLKLRKTSIGEFLRLYYTKNLALFTFVFSILFFTSFQSNAADYYWVGGSGTWTDLTHWASSNGGSGSAYGVQPQSTDNVFFTSLSGFTAANKILTLPSGTASTCKNLSFTTGITGLQIAGAASATFQSYGDVTLEPNMNFTTSWNYANWEFYQSSDGSVRTFQTANNSFIQNFKFLPPSVGTGGNFIVNGTLSESNGRITVDLQSASHQVTFNNLLSSNYMVNGSFVEVINGVLNTNQGLVYSGVNYGGSGFTVRKNGQWNNFGTVDAIGLTFAIEGKAYLNAGNTVGGNICKMWTLQNGVLQTPIPVLDFNHCSVYVYYSFSFGRMGITTSTINAANSTLNFMPGALYFYISNHTFNNVIVVEDVSSFFNCYIADQFNSVQTPTIDSLIIDRNTTFYGPFAGYTSGRGKLQITGLQKFTAGHQYVGDYFGSVHKNEFDLVSGAILDMQGSCENTITLKDTKFDLTGVGTMNVDNIVFEATNIAVPGSYSAGSGSIQVSGSLTGWTVGARAPRTLVYVADRPSNITNAATYGNWYNSDHWLDVTANPTWASNPINKPGAAGNTLALLNTCPPTEIDSVIFPKHSYVRCDKSTMYTEGMNWLDTGRIVGAHPQDLQIWGALYLSPQMINDFAGTVEFKSNRTYRCAITTNNQAFDLGVKFNSASGTGSWLLMDTLKVPKPDNFTNGTNAGAAMSIWVNSGHLYTGTLACTPGNGQTINAYGFRFDGSFAKLSLFDSDVHIKGLKTQLGPNIMFVSGGILNSGTSNLILHDQIAGANGAHSTGYFESYTYYDITARHSASAVSTGANLGLNFVTNCSVHNIIIEPDAYVNIANLVNSTLAVSPKVQKIENQSTKPLGFGWFLFDANRYGLSSTPASSSNTAFMRIDTLISNGNLLMGNQLTIYSYLQLPIGSSNSFGNATYQTTMNLAGASSYVSPYLYSCPGGGTISYPGATASFSGSCLGGNTTFQYGNFNVTSTLLTPFQYLTLDNNTVTGSGAPLTANNSTFVGVTTGWVGASSAPRKLHWVDVSGVNGNAGNWTDGSHWEQVLPFYAAAPQCPPTIVDTVLFDNTSFSNLNQSVNISAPNTHIATIKWENIPVGQAPKFVGSNLSDIYIHASLYFDKNMVNNTLGKYYFVGKPTPAFPVFEVKTGSVPLNGFIIFDGELDNSRWNLLDSIYQPASGGSMSFLHGELYTNGNAMNIGAFISNGTKKRYLDIQNSFVTLKANHYAYGDWTVGGTVVGGVVQEFTMNSTNSTLYSTSANIHGNVYALGGKNYHNIIIDNFATSFVGNNIYTTGNGMVSYGGTVDYIKLNGTGTGAVDISIDSLHVKKTEAFLFTKINSKGGNYDSLYFYNNGQFSSNNKYHNLLHFQPGKQYQLDANTVQWIQNKAELELNGITNTSKIQLFGTNIGNQGYIRKDSASICADFVDIKDVWAVGNGNDPANSCTSYGNSPVNNFTTHPNPWIVSMADTITDITADCGPWFGSNPSTFNRGRADFNLGASADLIGGNSFGWGKRPLSALPLISLGSYVTVESCELDTLLYDIEIVGDLPIKFTTHYVIDGDTIPTTIFVDEAGDFASGTGLPGDPFVYVDTLVLPVGADTIYVTNLQLEANRCYDNYSENLQTWTIVVNPTPTDLDFVTDPASAVFCPNSSVLVEGTSFVANTTFTLSTITPTVIGSHVLGGSVSTGALTADTTWFILEAETDKGCRKDTLLKFIVGDIIAPVVVCPSDTTIYLGSSCEISIMDYTAYATFSATDNCTAFADLVFQQIPVAGTLFSAETDTVITIIATDESGNKDTCYFSLTILDTIAPTIVCNASLSVNVNSSCEYQVPSILAEYSALSDNCTATSSIVLTQSIASGTDTSGVVVVWLTATDEYGNSDSCSVTLNPIDIINPTIICPSDLTSVAADLGSCVATGVNLGTPTTADNCSVASVTNNAPASFPLGTTVVTWTVTDGSGNTAMCTQNVVVVDIQNPTISCPSDLPSVSADAGSCVATGVNLGTPTTADNCSVASLTNDAPVIFPLGATVVTWIVTDGSGNTATCTQNVTVVDAQAPTISCPSDLTSVALDLGSCVATGVNLGTPTTADNCTVASVTNNAPASFPLGTTVVTWTVTDGSGNTATCAQNVTVVDTQNPTITCPLDLTSVALDLGSCVATGVNLGTPTTADNCSVASVTNNAPASFPLGTTVVTWTVTDGSGNTATCAQNVTVVDIQNPTISCPSDLPLVAADLGSCVATGVNLGTPTTADNCTVASVTNNAPASFPLGTTVVTWTVTDGSGNTATCTQNVTVVDTQDPTITCSSDQLVSTNADCEFVIPDYTGAATSDNCIGAVTVTQSPVAATIVTGNTTVTLTATDAAGNSVTCDFELTVEDLIDPVASCQPLTVYLNTSGTVAIDSSDINNGSTDNCGIETITLSQSTFDCSNIGTPVTVTMTVTDFSGNTATCNAIVTIEDTLAPTPMCENITVYLDAAGTVTIDSSDIDNGSTDNCGIETITLSQSTFDCSNVGTPVTVTMTVTDVNGNAAACNATVTVEDTLAPTPMCENITVYLDAAGTVTIDSSDIDNGSTDNCGIETITLSQSTFDCSNVGTPVTVTMTVTDFSGNSATCDATVTVEDTLDPTPMCENITVYLNALGTVAIDSSDIHNGSTDNCGIETITLSQSTFDCSNVGTPVTVTMTVTDVNGNAATCNATVTVEDTLDPTPMCENITVYLNASGTVAIDSSDIDNGSTDNCGIATITLSQSTFDCSNVGTPVTVTMTVTDVNGNAATCDAIVTVEDTILPTLTCNADTTVNPNSVNCSAELTLLDLVTDDNCSVETLTWTMSGATVATSPATGINNIGMYTFNSGVTTIEYIVTDASGNEASCLFTVTVTDTEAPVIEGCPSDTTLVNDPGICGAVVTWNISATDNCGTPTIVSSHNSGDVFPVGSTTVTITGTDGAGNESICNFTITVTDAEAPVITGLPTPSQATFCENEPVTWTAPTATDNCGVVSFTSSHQSGANFTVGSTTVTYTAVDAAGNTTTASFDVVVNALPEVNVSASSVEGCTSDALTLEVENPNASYSYEWEFNGSVVSSSSSYSISSVENADAGTYFVTATNEFGCSAQSEVDLIVKSCDITIFESFSPNGDGKNEFFYVEGLENFPNTKVIIYNRWGTEVFQSDDYQNDWDGRSQSNYNVGGDELPEASYFYLLELGGNPEDATYGKIYKGYVYLKR